MPDPSRQWTPSQLAGMTTTGQSLLLSAAAGSGKTSVLSERCVYLVCEAPGACEIDEILVVAFNEAAALEMKGRILQSLQTYFLKHPSERLEKQVALAERAAISTLHGFCLRLLRQHFHRVGLDPNFTVLDADETRLLRYDVARELFARWYEADDAGAFQTLIDQYGDGNDERLIGQVLKIHEMLNSVIRPDEWREEALLRLTNAAEQPLPDSELGRQFIQLVRDDLDLLASKIESALQLVEPLRAFDYYVGKFKEWRVVVAHWIGLLSNESFDTFIEEAKSIDDVLSERAKAVRGDVPGKELAQAAFKDVRDHMKDGFCRMAGRFTEEQWRSTVAATLGSARVLLDLVAEFETDYQAAKSQQRAVDFSDLERQALRVLSADESALGAAPSDVARAYHKRFKHVLVDEYQDINEVQDAILRLVSRECVADHATPSNLFCVGDVKQSIYRFRLAEPRRFLDRLHAFRSGDNDVPGRVIDLQENFRSRAPLLEAINDIFRRLMTTATAEIDYDASQELRPGAPYPPAGAGEFAGRPIEMHVLPAQLSRAASDEDEDADDFEQDEYEASLVARRILQLTGRDDESTAMHVMARDGDRLLPRPIRLGDIVVLLRARKFTADRYADVLRRSGIPAHADSGTGFFESQEIRDMLALLQVLDNPRQDLPLAAVLRGPIGRLNDRRPPAGDAPAPGAPESRPAVAGIGSSTTAGDSSSAPAGADDAQPTRRPPHASSPTATVDDALATIRLAYATEKPPLPFHEAVTRYAADQTDALAITLRDRLQMLADWRAMIHQRPVAEVLRSIYDDTGLLAWYAGLPDGDQRAANLESLYHRAAQFGTFARQGLARFLRFLENLQRDSDLGQPSLDAESTNVVRIMTIHQSKGLEFPVVFLPSTGRKFNRLDSTATILADRRSYFALQTVDEPRLVQYPSLATMVVRDTIDAQSTAEEIRILYVALTRAREHLILIGSAKEDAYASAQARWTDHTGPLPVATVRGARSMIDWLLPIAAAEGPSVIDVVTHSIDEMLALASGLGDRRSSHEALAPLAALQPLVGATADDPAAGRVLERVRFTYPHALATAAPAARSVTQWAKHDLAHAPERESNDKSFPTESSLDLPRFLSQAVPVKATDLGTFTHAALEHLTFGQVAPPLAAQIELMVTSQRLTAEQAQHIDLPALEWFLASDLGQRIAANADHLKRELPVYFAAHRDDLPAEQIMLRGRLDAFLDLPTGGIVIDYKTDRVAGAALDERAAVYFPQLRSYANAMGTITGRSVAESYLVFLQAKQIMRVPPA